MGTMLPTPPPDSTKTPLYSVATYDWERGAYTPQRGLSVPSYNMTWRQLVVAVRELKAMGYSAHRVRCSKGEHDHNDSEVLIERTDGMCPLQIRRNWER
jgi:hypothetical protein